MWASFDWESIHRNQMMHLLLTSYFSFPTQEMSKFKFYCNSIYCTNWYAYWIKLHQMICIMNQIAPNNMHNCKLNHIAPNDMHNCILNPQLADEDIWYWGETFKVHLTSFQIICTLCNFLCILQNAYTMQCCLYFKLYAYVMLSFCTAAARRNRFSPE